MNPLPDLWKHRVATHPEAATFVLIDAAMQPLLANRVTARTEARSLLPQAPKEARHLGPWLLPAAIATELGIDGCGRGINWLLSGYEMDALATHLANWTSVALPDEASCCYVRIADGRVLRSLAMIWSPRQAALFFAPFAAWCIADRDGMGACVSISVPEAVQTRIANPSDARLSRDQYRCLLDASAADQLLQDLKGFVQLHPDWGSSESRYRAAADALQLARRFDYEDPEDAMTIVARVLHRGAAQLTTLADHPAVIARRRGARFWAALMEEPNA
ncbi:DUF4123 domain-containing protein [Luteimonas yindakuii]|uniref:DUF4123 domain-containing protein n=1 Tax=Luteimonas yindakuii TaxID=2565782 RepID=UPI001107944F|nr:DUF4123 domain-containing protein [Luteimonas yindakuii]QCO66886.2 DUF4123 domain-containing protein [Luteimonas yindakuii]